MTFAEAYVACEERMYDDGFWQSHVERKERMRNLWEEEIQNDASILIDSRRLLLLFLTECPLWVGSSPFIVVAGLFLVGVDDTPPCHPRLQAD